MARVIKFRGKSVKTGEWLYGYLQKYQETHASRLCVCAASVRTWSDALLYEVIPETIGQFTDLHDKNDKEIYFDDIVRNKYGDIGSVIWFSDWSLRVDWGGGDIHFIDPEWGLEVIGNIHDNPELLKGE